MANQSSQGDSVSRQSSTESGYGGSHPRWEIRGPSVTKTPSERRARGCYRIPLVLEGCPYQLNRVSTVGANLRRKSVFGTSPHVDREA